MGVSQSRKGRKKGDFPGGPVAKTELPIQRNWFDPWSRELDPTHHD